MPSSPRSAGSEAATRSTPPEIAQAIKSLGCRIAELRREAGWTQGDLAARCARDSGQISRYENGHIVPSLQVLIAIATIFGVSTDYLLFEDLPRTPLYPSDTRLTYLLSKAQELPGADRTALCRVCEAFLASDKIRQVADDLSSDKGR